MHRIDDRTMLKKWFEGLCCGDNKAGRAKYIGNYFTKADVNL